MRHVSHVLFITYIEVKLSILFKIHIEVFLNCMMMHIDVNNAIMILFARVDMKLQHQILRKL